MLNDGKYVEELEETKKHIQELTAKFKELNPEGKIYLLYMPHCSEVSDEYKRNYEKMNAVFCKSFDSKGNF